MSRFSPKIDFYNFYMIFLEKSRVHRNSQRPCYPGKSGTYEEFGDTEDFWKGATFVNNGTYEKSGGTQKFPTSMLSGKIKTYENL